MNFGLGFRFCEGTKPCLVFPSRASRLANIATQLGFGMFLTAFDFIFSVYMWTEIFFSKMHVWKGLKNKFKTKTENFSFQKYRVRLDVA